MKLKKVISNLSLEQKVSLLSGFDNWHTPDIKKYGIPKIKMSDGPNGVRGDSSTKQSSACFPSPILLGATWNEKLIKKIGSATGEEALFKDVDVLLAPTINLHRHPLGGRHFECYSEDPILTSKIACAYVSGVQSKGVAACLKHFAGNDTEYERHLVSSNIDEKTLRELYLYPFEMGIKKAKAKVVMSAYNKVNNIYCSSHDELINKILKKEWKFDGYVVSDWGAALETVENANGGLDLEMPGPAKTWGKNLVDAVKAGLVEEKKIDEKVKRILTVAKFTDRFNRKRISERSIDKKSHRKLIKKTAIEGMVLLKNEDVLPLDRNKISNIALIGPNVKDSQIIGGGSAGLNPHYEIHPLEGVSNFLKDEKVKIHYAKGCHVDKYLPAFEKDICYVQGKKEKGFEVEFFRGKNFDGEPIERKVLNGNRFWALQGFAREFLDEKERPELSVKFSTTYKPSISGEFEFEVFSIGLSRIKINGKELVDNWSSQKKGEAFFGFACAPKRNKIKLTKGKEYLVEVEYEFEGRFPAIQFGCRPPDPKNLLEEAVKIAKQSDAVVLVVGTNSDWETEGNDRKGLGLPSDQDVLIRKVLAANKNSVLVLNTGSPVSMPWIKSCPAILQTWFPGQEFGNALAEILFGKESPSGKLPTTYPKKLSDTPAYSCYPGKNLQMDYKEKLLVGYKWYEKKKIEPLFPFGHGLSYSKFELKKVSLLKKKHEIKIKVKLKNIGNFSTFETVQCYLERKAVKADTPKKKLVDFKKLKVTKDKSKKLTLKVSKRDLSEWDVKKSKWEIARGDYVIHVGTSVRDISITEEIKI
jgi:beta-glucosidase|tara:strand:- start:438 stop:2873 length:2436 start_codon:yes stop_codon:yes gene_type:complete